ncbi:MAG: YraN family protein, partial [Gemmatimonadaceae bacterium]
PPRAPPRRYTRAMTKATNNFGELGERIAARWLERHGYTVLARRWRSGHRDIDVIAERDGVVAFVEVKTRAAMEFGDPVEAVHAQKQRSLVRSAREWMARHEGAHSEFRFDVIGILLRDRSAWVRHIESAFTV